MFSFLTVFHLLWIFSFNFLLHESMADKTIFHSLNPIRGYLSGEIFVDYLITEFHLSHENIRNIFNYSNIDLNYKLSYKSFCDAMELIKISSLHYRMDSYNDDVIAVANDDANNNDENILIAESESSSEDLSVPIEQYLLRDSFKNENSHFERNVWYEMNETITDQVDSEASEENCEEETFTMAYEESGYTISERESSNLDKVNEEVDNNESLENIVCAIEEINPTIEYTIGTDEQFSRHHCKLCRASFDRNTLKVQNENSFLVYEAMGMHCHLNMDELSSNYPNSTTYFQQWTKIRIDVYYGEEQESIYLSPSTHYGQQWTFDSTTLGIPCYSPESISSVNNSRMEIRLKDCPMWKLPLEKYGNKLTKVESYQENLVYLIMEKKDEPIEVMETFKYCTQLHWSDLCDNYKYETCITHNDEPLPERTIPDLICNNSCYVFHHSCNNSHDSSNVINYPTNLKGKSKEEFNKEAKEYHRNINLTKNNK